MLKFSGFAYLTSCLEWDLKEEICVRYTINSKSNIEDTRSVIQIACWRQHLYTECVKGLSSLTHKHAHTMVSKLLWMILVAWISIDTEAGMLSGISRKRSIRSNPYWFTEFCNSQCLSHFAAPFIVVRAETSVAESCVWCKRWSTTQSKTQIHV